MNVGIKYLTREYRNSNPYAGNALQMQIYNRQSIFKYYFITPLYGAERKRI